MCPFPISIPSGANAFGSAIFFGKAALRERGSSAASASTAIVNRMIRRMLFPLSRLSLLTATQRERIPGQQHAGRRKDSVKASTAGRRFIVFES